MRYTSVALLLVATPAGVWAQSSAADTILQREVRSLIEAEVAQDRFSGVVLVARDGVPIVSVAGGMANSERRLPITSDVRFNLASGDKLFTKIAIMQLVQRGRLRLSDTVGAFLPKYLDATVRHKVTVEHLLRHQSGLGSYWNDAYQRNRTRLQDHADLIPLFEAAPLAFEPGTRMLYSNSGYVILGRIIEVVTGQSYYDYVQANIFKPAGMTHTAYLTIDEWPADKAVGYTTSDSSNFTAGGTTAANARAANGWSLAFRGSAAGGGYSTVGDLLALEAAVRRGTLVDTALLSRFTAVGPGGRRMLANGGGPGANFEFTRAGEYTIIVLSNYDPPSATRVSQQLTALLQAPSPRFKPSPRGRRPMVDSRLRHGVH